MWDSLTPTAELPLTLPSTFQDYLKLEPEEFESTMYRNSDCEFFQDLGLWCSGPAKEEQVQIIGEYLMLILLVS